MLSNVLTKATQYCRSCMYASATLCWPHARDINCFMLLIFWPLIETTTQSDWTPSFSAGPPGMTRLTRTLEPTAKSIPNGGCFPLKSICVVEMSSIRNNHTLDHTLGHAVGQRIMS